MKQKVRFTLLTMVLALGIFGIARNGNAFQSYQDTYNSTYGARATGCTLCHPGGNTGSFTAAGSAFQPSHNYAAIAPAPRVTGFSIPATSASLTVPITTFTGTDNPLAPLSPITGYMVTESATAPSYSAPGWSATPPASYTFAGAGAKTLYAWVLDYVSVVSPSPTMSASVTIGSPDATPPTVTGFSVPATSSSLTVSIAIFTATDNVGVTGYLINESAANPGAAAAGWSAAPPASYTFTTAGTKTLFAWAKDAAGNISNSLSASVTITPTDATPPTVTGFSVPATSSSLRVSITTFTATDNVGVAGYLVNESATNPGAAAAGWSATPPASYTFTTAGTKTLFAWAKDAAGNISNSLSASVTITSTGPANVLSIAGYLPQWFLVLG